jgi:mono/diheme cytochrome c family protein
MRRRNATFWGLVAIGGAVLGVASIVTASAETLRERGAYLVTTVGSCGNCHSPRDPAGNIIPDAELSGGFTFDTHEPGIGIITPPNITPDKDTGIGTWSEADIVNALRNGKRPDGSLIGPPMPIPVYRQLSDSDARAIAVYLKSLKPIRHAVPERNHYTMQLPPDYGPAVTHVAEPERSDMVAYGGYLVTFAHCVLCHTPPAKDGPFDMSRAFTGGRDLPNFPNSSAIVVSRNITQDPVNGIGKWTNAEIKHAIVTGIRPDGTKLARTMAFDWYAKMHPADLDDIVAFLRTVQPPK